MTDTPEVQELIEATWQHYATAARHDLPWRIPSDTGFDAYKIMVSEIMLQQTQVSRVIEKYQQFLTLFPDVQALAAADLGAVLSVWSGLGYNRRAKFLWQAATMVVHEYNGVFPITESELVRLPGIGKNTAGAIVAYAYNQPTVFIETNIRTVFIHHCFPDDETVSDAQLVPLIEAAVDHDSPREWYWALMDYGSYLKKTVGNLSRYSKTYTKQSSFHGSRRQVRGQVIAALLAEPLTLTMLRGQIDDERLPAVLADLSSEGLIRLDGEHYRL